MRLLVGSPKRKPPTNQPSSPTVAPHNDLQPLVSPAYEDMPMWSILPSYQLFQSTFSKNILPENEDVPPPTYIPTSSDGYFPEVASDSLQSPTRWEDTILANSHRLKTLNDFQHLHISVQLTSVPNRVGVPPHILDPDSLEFVQGDSIHGFVTIMNTAPFSLPFDMFSVVFEGKVSVMGESEKKEPLVFYKFLNMFDYNASWTPANFDDQDDILIDPIDNSRKYFSMEKYFEPNVTYKKFFNFRIPERLLDCACENQYLQRHIQIVPTIGLSKDKFLKDIRKLREKSSKRPVLPRKRSTFNETVDRRIKDFSFSDTAISYSVEARVIGRNSAYTKLMGKCVPPGEKDEYLIVNDASCFIRVVPRESLGYEFDNSVLDRQSHSVYNTLVRSVIQKIQLGKELAQEKHSESSETTNELGRASSITKRKQLFQKNESNGSKLKTRYEIFYPYKKKSLTLPPKIVAIIGIATEKTEYKVLYCPPYNFKTLSYSTPEGLSTSIQVPIDLTIQFNNEVTTKSHKLPEIKSIGAELVVITYRTKKYPIPIEVTHDLVFKNNGDENDNFEAIVTNPFKKYLAELSELMKKFSSEVLDVDSQLILDMKSLANLQTKRNIFRIESTRLSNITTSWQQGSLTTTFEKKLIVSMDLKGILTKQSSDDFTSEAHALVPNFQSCFIGRTYYILVTVRLQNGDSPSIKIPIRIVR